MSYPKGGISDKLGNEYESNFVCKKLIEMLLENEINYIKYDSIGDETDIDLQCAYKDKLILYQVKSRNGDSDEWRISELTKNNIFNTIKKYIAMNKEYDEFHIVTAISSIELSDFLDNLRKSNTIEELMRMTKYRIQFEKFKDSFNKEEGKERKELDEQEVYLILKNVYIDTIPENIESKKNLKMLSEVCFNGDGKIIIPIMKDFLKETYNKQITKEMVIKWFEDRNIYTCEKLKEDIDGTISSLRKSFVNNISESLISNNLLHRQDTDKCIEKINNSQILIIAGDSGVGKSGIVLEILKKLEDDFDILPLRLDRIKMKESECDFSKTLGFKNKITSEIYRLSKDKNMLIILDQLDALKSIGQEAKNAQDVCKEIIDGLIEINHQYKRNIKLIITCRTYDLKHIPFINYIREKRKKIVSEHEVGLLNDKELNYIEEITGIRIPDNVKEIVRNINNLKMWLYVKNKSNYKDRNDLIRQYIKEKKEEICNKGCKEVEINEVINKVVNYMDNNNTLYIEKSEIETDIAYEYLISSGILIESIDDNVTFSHQSLYDYLLMKKIDDEINIKKNIIEWLGDKQKQNLKTCYRLENYIKMKIQENTRVVCNIINKIINNTKVRYIIKFACISAINMLRENNDDIENIIVDKCDKEGYIQMCNNAICGNEILTKAVITKEKLKTMLLSKNQVIINSANSIIYEGNKFCAKELLNIFNEIRINNNAVLINTLKLLQRRGFSKIDKLIQSYIIDNIDDYFDFTWLDIREYMKVDNRIFSKLVYVLLEKNIREKQKIKAYVPRESKDIIIDELSKKVSFEMFEKCMAIINSIDEEYNNRYYWFGESEYYEEESLISFIKNLLIKSGKNFADKFPYKIVETLNYNCNEIVEMMSCEIFTEIKKESDLVCDWLLQESKRLHISKREYTSMPEATYRLIKEISPYFSEKKFKELENTLYYYKDENMVNRIKEILRSKKDNENINISYLYNRDKYILLCALDIKRTVKKTKELISSLKRVIEQTPEEMFEKYGIISGGFYVKSTIRDNVKKLSDKTWENLITKNIVDSNTHKIKDGYSLESSNEAFAQDFKRCLTDNPKRFLNLIKKCNKKINIEYIECTIQGLIEIYRGQNESLINDIIDETIFIIKKYYNIEHNYSKVFIAELIGYVISYKQDADLIEILISYTEDGFNQKLIKYQKEDIFMQLETIRINSLAGMSIQTIAKIIDKNNELANNTKVIELIEKYAKDSNINKRYFTLPFILSLLEINNAKALELLEIAVGNNVEFMVFNYGIKIFMYLLYSNPTVVNKMVQKMKKSKIKRVLEFYGEYIGNEYIKYNRKKTEKDIILSQKGVNEKIGLCNIVKAYLKNENLYVKCKELAIELLETKNKEVMKQLASIFWDDNIITYNFLNEHKDLVIELLKSAAFVEEFEFFSYIFNQKVDNIMYYTDIIFQFTVTVINDCNKIEVYELEELLEILIKINEQSINYGDEIEEQSLELIDKLCEKYEFGLDKYLQNIFS